jgi:hypothetical protein
MEQRKYWVKRSWIFNLESMNDKLWCIVYDMRDGLITEPVEIAGHVLRDEDEVLEFKEMVNELEWTAKSGRVTGKEYGLIADIVNWRVLQRYLSCVNGGMTESRAGECFSDL